MYGMVNRAIEDMVCQNYGDAAWQRIREKASVDVEIFMSNEGYPDEITYNLVSAASEELAIGQEKVLHAFGEHWILHTALEGYGGLMHAAGNSLKGFLINLPNFHSRVAMIFPKLRPPRFTCSDINSDSMCLHYYTHRPGLEPFVVGLIHGLGKMYDTAVTAEIIESRNNGDDHDVFYITWMNPKG
jgi:hypothetical protein